MSDNLVKVVMAGVLLGATACATRVDPSSEPAAWSLLPKEVAEAPAPVVRTDDGFDDGFEALPNLIDDELTDADPMDADPTDTDLTDTDLTEVDFSMPSLAQEGVEPAEAPAPKGEAFSDDQWHFVVAPYGWLPTIKTWVNQDSITVHKGDLLDDLNMTYMGVLAARYNRWGIMLDSIYFRISDDVDPTPRPYDKAKVKESLYQLQGAYRLGDEDTYVDLTAGARWIALTTAYRVAGITVGRQRVDWFEPVIGAHGWHRLAERWKVAARADVGGFGLGEAAQITWQALGRLEYEVSKTVTLAAGWRYVYFDQQPNYGIKQRVAGPFMGMQINF